MSRRASAAVPKLRWKVFVDAKIYAAYFFSLMEGIRPAGCRTALNLDCMEKNLQGESKPEAETTSSAAQAGLL